MDTSYRTDADSVKGERTPTCARGFVMLPDSIIFDPQLSPMDVRVCAALLTYARTDDPTACPSQESLAERLGCSVDTIQRAETRLVAAGAMTTHRHRRQDGKLGRRVCNLTPILSVIKALIQTARLRRGSAPSSSKSSPARPHGRGVREYSQPQASKVQPTPYDSGGSSPGLVESGPLDAVVVSLREIGLSAGEALRLAKRFTADQLAHAIRAFRAAPSGQIRAPMAWLTEAARGHWQPASPPEPKSGGLPPGSTVIFKAPPPPQRSAEEMASSIAQLERMIPAAARLRRKMASP